MARPDGTPGEAGAAEDRAAVLPAWSDAMLAELTAGATPERAEREKAYLKSDLDFLGATVPAIRSVVKAFHRSEPGLTREELVALVERLWAMGIHELRMAAVELLDIYSDLLTPADLGVMERLIRESGTWALVDGLAATVTGSLVERFPDTLHPVLERWAGDDDLWVRRASLLAYLPGLRRGQGHFHRFAALADGLLHEREFFIRKAIGWVLRETGKRRPGLIVEWLEPRIARASGLTVREAVKYLPDPDRQRLLEARQR